MLFVRFPRQLSTSQRYRTRPFNSKKKYLRCFSEVFCSSLLHYIRSVRTAEGARIATVQGARWQATPVFGWG